MQKFPYSPEGFKKAKKYLKKIGAWDNASKHGFSVDGYSIVHTANSIYSSASTIHNMLMENEKKKRK